jgi:hypothetical protein
MKSIDYPELKDLNLMDHNKFSKSSRPNAFQAHPISGYFSFVLRGDG